jgi:hypothetical protein
MAVQWRRASFPREPKSAGAEEPLVAIMGPDNVPVLVRRSQAEGKRPASTREQGRPVMVSSAKDMADIDEAMKLAQQLDFDQKDTGIMPAIGGAMPDAVTNLTGFGMEAKKRSTLLDALTDAGFDTSKFIGRGEPNQESSGGDATSAAQALIDKARAARKPK